MPRHTTTAVTTLLSSVAVSIITEQSVQGLKPKFICKMDLKTAPNNVQKASQQTSCQR